jgi:MFS family permease
VTSDIAAPPRAGRRQWYGLAVLLIALMLTVINGTMIAVLMPEIIADLDMSLLQAEWANAGYTLTFAALLLPAGWLGDRFGRRRMLIVGIGIFLVGTLGVGAATSGSLLIAARVV